MTTAATSAPVPAARGAGTPNAGVSARLRAALAEARRREPRVTAFALGCGVLGAAAFAAAAVDPRQFGGVSVWLKPAKFFVSTGVFALTWAWFAGLVHPDHRGARGLRAAAWALVGSGTFELAYIAWQAARGEASHFNIGDPLHALMYALMGVGAVVLIGSNLPLARAVARRPAPGVDAEYRRAVVLGLVLTFLLGGVLGGYMSAQTGHAVGPESAHLAVTGWNRSGGDLRVAHFLGLHAEQGLPLAAWAAAATGLRRRRLAGWLVAVAWSAATLLAFAQAVAGRPFPFG